MNTLRDLALHSLHQLDWPDVQAAIAHYVLTPYGERAWVEQPFFDNSHDAYAHIQQVAVLQTHIARHGWPSHTDAKNLDLHPVMTRLSKGGTFTLPELIALRHWLTLTRHWVHALQADADTMNELVYWYDGLNAPPVSLRRYINQIITEHGELSPQAHPELGRLLHQQKSLKQAAEQHIQTLLQQPDVQMQLQSAQVMIREGQLALAVKAVHKNSFPGELVSTSATGSTVFMVPKVLIPLNKKLLDVENDIALVIERILQDASQQCSAVMAELNQALMAMGQIDRRLSAAYWAKHQHATVPILLEKPGQLTLIDMRHPLLDNAVPNTVRLGQPDRSLVITGPNTGGKTVLLKIIGLAALLVKAGLPLPASSGCAISWFDDVYADIGDEQSLAQSLSTFSAHLVKLRLLTLPETDLSQSLVLLDEIAAGTDPTEGGVLAQAVLKTIHSAGAVSVITTHLGSLKLFAHEADGFENASVSFDSETLSPTYKLLQGIPGTSHALSIAERLGINPQVINLARSQMTAGERDTSGLLEQLATQQAKIQEELHKATSYRKEAQAAFERLNEQRHKLEQERKQLLHQLKTQIHSQTRDIQDQLKRLRKRVTASVDQANTQNMGKLSEQLHRVADRTATIFTKADHPLAKLPKKRKLTQVAIGDDVYCKKLNMNMQVTAIHGDKIQVSSGLVKSYVTLKDIEPRQSNLPTVKTLIKAQQRSAYNTVQPSTPDESKTFVDLMICDVRGQSADDAIAKLTQFLDQALLAGFDKVSIVHGLGTGALKHAIREDLKRNSLVKNYYPAQAVDGGDGKTIIELQ